MLQGAQDPPRSWGCGQECRIIGVRVLRNQSYFPKSRTAEVSLWQIFHYFEKNNSIKKKATYIVYAHHLIPFLYLVLTSLMSHPVLLFFKGSSIVIQSLYFDWASPNPQLKQGSLPPVVKSHSWGRASLGGLTVYSPGAAEGHHKN